MPFIPGSSLKGAVRTAYLNALAKERDIVDWWHKSKDPPRKKASSLEIHLLNGSFSTDPFRMLKISDLQPHTDVKTKLLYVVNLKKSDSSIDNGRGVPQILEVIQPGSCFQGFLTLNIPIQECGIKNPIEYKKLFQSLSHFYNKLLESEIKLLKTKGVHVPLINKLNKNFKGKIGKSAFLVRIGKHSGAEAVTIENNRRIKISPPGKPAKFSNKGATTIWLSSDSKKTTKNMTPLGWAVLEVE